MRVSLVPRTSEFYDLFTRAGANALEAARLVEQRFREYPSSSVTQADVKAAEHEGDTITRDLIQLLNTQYITPFDREDIYELATSVDDVVDHIDEASDLLELYGVESPTRQAIEQCRILVGAAEHLATALARAEGAAAASSTSSSRSSSSRTRATASSATRSPTLFRDPRIDPLIVIRWKDIFEALEDALDACETAANVIGNIVVKNV